MLNTRDYNALSLAQPTNFKGMLQSGQHLWGTGCRIAHPEAARVIATTPYHFCFIDAEHTPFNATLLIEMVRTIQYHSQGSMVPFVRIPSYTSELIPFALNAGAGGIVMPRVQDAKQAQELVRLARFPSYGERGFPPAALIGPSQNRTPNGLSTYDVWNNHAAVICQIEDLVGLENIDEICRVPGVDGIFVGTGDLRLCMDLAPGSLDGDEPVFVAALEKIRDTAEKHGLPIMGFGLSPSTLQQRIRMGWSAFIVHGDIDAICNSAVQSLELFSRAASATNGHEPASTVTNGHGPNGTPHLEKVKQIEARGNQ